MSIGIDVPLMGPLVELYQNWCKRQNLKCISADEQLHELLDGSFSDIDAAKQVRWLKAFIELWEQTV